MRTGKVEVEDTFIVGREDSGGTGLEKKLAQSRSLVSGSSRGSSPMPTFPASKFQDGVGTFVDRHRPIDDVLDLGANSLLPFGHCGSPPFRDHFCRSSGDCFGSSGTSDELIIFAPSARSSPKSSSRPIIWVVPSPSGRTQPQVRHPAV